ncbi:MAG: BrnT family toxin [Bryobacteraceae bacterium]
MNLQANGFDWDKGNRAKCEKHGLSTSVIESLFTRPLAILPDAAHSQRERRFRAIGRTDKGRRGVFIVFTLRRKGDELLIRPISARYMHKKEIEAYEKENPGL